MIEKKMSENLLPNLKINEEKLEDSGKNFCPSRNDMNKFIPCMRNQINFKFTNVYSVFPHNMQKPLSQSVGTVYTCGLSSLYPKTKPSKSNTLPRSKLFDIFFSHRMRGSSDSLLNDVRRILRIKNHLKRIAESASRQTKLSMHHLNQNTPEIYLLATKSNGDYNPITSISKLIERDKCLCADSKVFLSTTSSVL